MAIKAIKPFLIFKSGATVPFEFSLPLFDRLIFQELLHMWTARGCVINCAADSVFGFINDNDDYDDDGNDDDRMWRRSRQAKGKPVGQLKLQATWSQNTTSCNHVRNMLQVSLRTSFAKSCGLLHSPRCALQRIHMRVVLYLFKSNFESN